MSSGEARLEHDGCRHDTRMCAQRRNDKSFSTVKVATHIISGIAARMEAGGTASKRELQEIVNMNDNVDGEEARGNKKSEARATIQKGAGT